MSMSRAEAAEFKQLVESVQALREGLQAALVRIEALEKRKGKDGKA